MSTIRCSFTVSDAAEAAECQHDNVNDNDVRAPVAHCIQAAQISNRRSRRFSVAVVWLRIDRSHA
jgi:hypothetical protein